MVDAGKATAVEGHRQDIGHWTSAHQGGASFKNACPAREKAAPRTNFAKDVTNDFVKGKAEAETSTADKAE
eukprot:jgi/Tetstr1/427274/TSEL_001727.t1